MDYTSDSCMNTFSEGQIERMQQQYLAFRDNSSSDEVPYSPMEAEQLENEAVTSNIGSVTTFSLTTYLLSLISLTTSELLFTNSTNDPVTTSFEATSGNPVAMTTEIQPQPITTLNEVNPCDLVECPDNSDCIEGICYCKAGDECVSKTNNSIALSMSFIVTILALYI